MKLNENPLKKSYLPQQNNNQFEIESIDLTDIPDFLFPEKDPKVSELYIYLTQTINWPYYSLNDIYSKLQNNNNLNFIEWQKEIETNDKDKKNRIINSINKSSKLLIEYVVDYMKFLNFVFLKSGEKIRTFIFLEYFLKKLEKDKYIINSDNYAQLYKLYIQLCRDHDIIFDYLERNNILTKNELFYYEKGCFYEKLHKYYEANQTYIEGFINILNENNVPQNGKVIINNYINFENRMLNRISRDLVSLDDDWTSIDINIHKKIKEYKEKNYKSLNSDKKYSINIKDENMEDKLIKNINYNFSLEEGRLNLLENNGNSNGVEIIGEFGEIKFIKNPPDINKVTTITNIYVILKNYLSLYYPEWKKEYDNFDLEVEKANNNLPYSWINKLRPTKRNLKNLQDNIHVLNLIQKEYINAGNININDDNEVKNEMKNIDNNKDISINEDINIKESIKDEHEISNMLSNLLFEDKNNQNNNLNNNIINKPFVINNQVNNNNMQNQNNNQTNKLIEKDKDTLLYNLKYQMEHQIYKKENDNISNNNNNIPKQQKKVKKNKFKCIGTLNFDQDGLMLINLSDENDQKIDIMQSATKLLNKDNDRNEEKKHNKKYTITLDNAPRRIKYIKEKTIKEKKLYEKRKQEMLQGVNFDYLNSFKKLFETYPELNNLIENDQQTNQNKKINEIKLDSKREDNKNIDVSGDINIQRENGPSEAMRLLLEVYGIPPNFLEENNPFIEYAKKNGIKNNNFMFENIFKEIKSYINAKSNKRKKNVFQLNKNNNNNNENNNEIKEDKVNIDADGDLIIESESEDNNNDNNNNNNNNKKDNINNNENSSKNSKNKNKESKHCFFDSKKNDKIIFEKDEKENEDKDGFGKIMDDINKKAEKGIKIGQKTIFSNYKGVREHSFNKNDNNNNNNNNNVQNEDKFKIENKNEINNDKNINNNIINNELNNISINNEKKIKEETDINKIMITNSKISTDIFMNALNFNNDHNINKKNNNRNNSKKNKKIKNKSKNQNSYPSSDSLNSDNYDNDYYYSEANNYLRNKNEKEDKRITMSVNDEQKINNFKVGKEKELSNIKEKLSIEKEKNSKKKKKSEEQSFAIDIEVERSNKNKYSANIGNIHDLDNFDDLFK